MDSLRSKYLTEAIYGLKFKAICFEWHSMAQSRNGEKTFRENWKFVVKFISSNFRWSWSLVLEIRSPQFPKSSRSKSCNCKHRTLLNKAQTSFTQTHFGTNWFELFFSSLLGIHRIVCRCVRRFILFFSKQLLIRISAESHFVERK